MNCQPLTNSRHSSRASEFNRDHQGYRTRNAGMKNVGQFLNRGWVPNKIKKDLDEAAANKALGRRRK